MSSKNYKDYTLLEESITYTCPRTGRTLTCKFGDKSDGATWARDISGPVLCQRGIRVVYKSAAPWFHDLATERTTWDCGEKISNFDASLCLSRTLWKEGRYFLAPIWFLGTFALGGKRLAKF